LSLGYQALLYDSAAVVVPSMASTAFPPLIDNKSVMDSAQAALQRAIDAANLTVTGTDGFPIPDSWLPSPTSWTTANFISLVRSYRARFTAGNARTATERAAPCVFAAGARTCAAANWAFIVADAAAGITADHQNTTSTTSGPFNAWIDQYESFGTWSQMPGFIIGMAEPTVGGNYDTWVKTDIGARALPFFMVTPDLRFPQGATRALQQADFAISSCSAASTTCKRYFVNRSAANDQNVGAGWGWSNYDFARFHSWRTNGSSTARNGPLVYFTKAENDLLRAEGQYRLGNLTGVNGAADLVNRTRTVAGLAAFNIATVTAATLATDCVPRVPFGAGTTATLSCGTLWEALKYEKRIETAFTHFAAWFIDSRGWGDLPKDTPLYWATPYQDVLARGKAISSLYGTGPSTNPSNAVGSAAAALGTYGY